MHIRHVTPGEETALLAIFQSSVRGQACRDYTPEQIDAWAPRALTPAERQAWIARVASNHPWVVEVNGQLAAFADLQPSGYIDQFFVATECTGNGVGRALMQHLHEVAASRGIMRLHAHVSLTAQPFFARCGFTIEEEQLPVVRGVALRNAVMSKQLP
ncbi:MAG: GNAT family N-acetyltransferase [Lysobacteraceae bacterium]|nr:MAG: GNAT family N-acetyltransferase [Xanthomonadaceae bacterium]